MPEFIVRIGYERGFIEADRAYSDAIRTGAYEFNGYNVFADGDMFYPFMVSPVIDPQAPAEYVTTTGGRYNRVH